MTLPDLIFFLVLPLSGGALLVTLLRLLQGPSLPDRVVALDLLSMQAIGIIAAYAVVMNQAAFLDIAGILALISFLGTVAFAYYVEKHS